MPSPQRAVAFPYEVSAEGSSLKLPSVWHLRRLHLWITLEALGRKGLGEAGGLAAAFREGFVNHNRPVER